MIEIRNLFFNTPVRKKFIDRLKPRWATDRDIYSVGLAYPHIHFTLPMTDETVYDLPPTDEWNERIATFYGRELSDDMIGIEQLQHDGDLAAAGMSRNRRSSRQ